MADDKLKTIPEFGEFTRTMVITCNTDGTCGNCRCKLYDKEGDHWWCMASGHKVAFDSDGFGDEATKVFKCPECDAATNLGFAGVMEFFISGVPILVNEGPDCSACAARFPNNNQENDGWDGDCGIYGAPIKDCEQLEACRLNKVGDPPKLTSAALWEALRLFRQELTEGKQIEPGTIITFKDESGTLKVLEDGEVLSWEPYISTSLLAEWGKKPRDWQKKLQSMNCPPDPKDGYTPLD